LVRGGRGAAFFLFFLPCFFLFVSAIKPAFLSFLFVPIILPRFDLFPRGIFVLFLRLTHQNMLW